MLKYMYHKNPRLTKIMIILMTLILVYGILLFVDAIQQEQRKKNMSQSLDIKTSTEEFRAYDVNGMTDEQIEQWLIQEREKRGINNGEEETR